jgi:hypothetical protein
LYRAGGVEGRHSAYDLRGARDVRLTITDTLSRESWQRRREQIQELADAYQYRPQS